MMRYQKGQICENARGRPFVIVEVLPNNRRIIKFLQTGTLKNVHVNAIQKQTIKDNFEPTIHGVGYIGNMDNVNSHYLYHRWNAMIHRCYNENCVDYVHYGKIGCTVCDEWLCFETYVRDIESLPNCQFLKLESKKWEIDKDLKCVNNKVYSKNTVSIIPKSHNLIERNSRKKFINDKQNKQVVMMDLNEVELKNFNSIKDALYFINHNLKNDGGIGACINGRQKTAYGYKRKIKQ